MSFNPDIHQRRSIRIPGYDYSRAGMYFITLCTWNREYLFGDIVDGEMRLNGVGLVVANSWKWLETQYDYVSLDQWVVMPNHFHGIIAIHDGSSVNVSGDYHCRGGSRTAPTKRKPVGQLLGAFKTVSTKHTNILQSTPGGKLWQRNYWERVIRDDAELAQTREYIASNPARWDSDQLR